MPLLHGKHSSPVTTGIDHVMVNFVDLNKSNWLVFSDTGQLPQRGEHTDRSTQKQKKLPGRYNRPVLKLLWG